MNPHKTSRAAPLHSNATMQLCNHATFRVTGTYRQLSAVIGTLFLTPSDSTQFESIRLNSTSFFNTPMNAANFSILQSANLQPSTCNLQPPFTHKDLSQFVKFVKFVSFWSSSVFICVHLWLNTGHSRKFVKFVSHPRIRLPAPFV